MMKIKDFYLSLLSENKEDFFFLDKNSIDKINDVHFSNDYNYIRIDFTTTYDKPMSLVTNYDDFKKWKSENQKSGKQSVRLFKEYIKDFIETSDETDSFFDNINEIVDDNGDIMSSTDIPQNSTRMVGDKIKWDLERVYRSNMPKGIRYLSGSLGLGSVTW